MVGKATVRIKPQPFFMTYALIQRFICNHMIASFMLHPLYQVENHVFDNNGEQDLEMHRFSLLLCK